MKISRRAIQQFRKICKNEHDTPTDEITYKLRRDLALGTLIHIVAEEEFIVAFGTLRILCKKGVVESIWRDNKLYRVNKYEKYKYDFENRGSAYANSKCSR